LAKLRDAIQLQVREIQSRFDEDAPDTLQLQWRQRGLTPLVREFVEKTQELQERELGSLSRELEELKTRIQLRRQNLEQLVDAEIKALFAEAENRQPIAPAPNLSNDPLLAPSAASSNRSGYPVPVGDAAPGLQNPLTTNAQTSMDAANAQTLVDAWRNVSQRQYELIETRQQELEAEVRNAEFQLQAKERDRDELMKSGDFDEYIKHWTDKLQRAQQGLARLAEMQKRDAQLRQFYTDTSMAHLRQAQLALDAAETVSAMKDRALEQFERLHNQGHIPASQVLQHRIPVIQARQNAEAARTAVQVWQAAVSLMRGDTEENE
jgi:hypothetical protein